MPELVDPRRLRSPILELRVAGGRKLQYGYGLQSARRRRLRCDAAGKNSICQRPGQCVLSRWPPRFGIRLVGRDEAEFLRDRRTRPRRGVSPRAVDIYQQSSIAIAVRPTAAAAVWVA